MYSKEVQTTLVEATKVPPPEEADVQETISGARDAEVDTIAQETELEEENAKLDKEIEDEIRGESCRFYQGTASLYHCSTTKILYHRTVRGRES